MRDQDQDLAHPVARSSSLDEKGLPQAENRLDLPRVEESTGFPATAAIAGEKDAIRDVAPPRIDAPLAVAPNGAATGTPMPVAADGPVAAAAQGRALPIPDRSLPRRPLTRWECTACIASIVGWIVLVTAGVAVPTNPYIKMMETGAGIGVPGMLWVFCVLITCYTFTNIAFLCCLSAIIGAVGRSARIDGARGDCETNFPTLCIAAIIRGFFMYIVIVSGTLILADQKFDDISIQQYLQLAGLVSLLSFAVGYDPALFGRIMSRVSSYSESLETKVRT